MVKNKYAITGINSSSS